MGAAALQDTAYLLLDVAGTPCALPRAAVAEVLPLPELHRPPAVGGWLAGFLNLGGEAVPVIDLAPLLGLRSGASEPDVYAHLVLLRGDLAAEGRREGSQAGPIAYLVDRVTDLASVPAAAIRPAAEAGSLNGCVAAEIVSGERLVHALAPERLLTAHERARVAALARAAADRLAALPEVAPPAPVPLA